MTADMTINIAHLRALRESRGWSQEHLANAAGVGLRTVQRVESLGTSSHETILCIAAALETDIGTLLASNAAKPAPSPVTGHVPAHAPLYVKYGLLGLYTRRSALAFMWLCIGLALLSIALGIFIPRFYVGSSLLIAALWYWAAAHWLDHNGGWPEAR